jgi:hypothetical protein
MEKFILIPLASWLKLREAIGEAFPPGGKFGGRTEIVRS